MIVHLGKTVYNVDTTKEDEAMDIVREFCKERGCIYTAPLIVDAHTQHVDITTKSGKVITCKIYDKR